MLKIHWPTGIFAFLALSAALGIGCGGGDEDGSTVTVSSKVVPKAVFLKRANAICFAAHERTSKEFGEYISTNTIPSSGPGMIAKAEDVIATVFRPAYELQIEMIGKLGSPRGDRQQVETILTAMQDGIDQAGQEPLEFIRHESSFDHASRLAIAYGLGACGNGNV
jgi:hypothetical protein